MRSLSIPLCVLVLTLPACVLKTHHDDAVARKIELSEEVSKLQSRNSELDKKLDSAEARAGELAERNQALSDTNQMLSGKSGECSEKILEKQKEILELRKAKVATEDRIAFLGDTYDDLVRTLKAEIEGGQVLIARQGDRLAVNVSNRILFASGSHEVATGGKTVLKKVAEALKNVTDRSVHVEGYTDNVPILGPLSQKYPSNWELSTARATSVVRILEGLGIPSERLAAVGYGEWRPVADNRTAEGRSRNRRIEIVLAPMPSGPEKEPL